jgi:hypothetical protein
MTVIGLSGHVWAWLATAGMHVRSVSRVYRTTLFTAFPPG